MLLTTEIICLIVEHLPLNEQWKLIVSFQLPMKRQILQQFSELSMDSASKNGHLSLLDFWKNSGLELKWSEKAMDDAKNIRILNWWKHSGLELKYSQNAMDHSQNTCILNWWRGSGLELKYSKNILKMHQKEKKIFNWWKKSGLVYEEAESFEIDPAFFQTMMSMFNLSQTYQTNGNQW